MNLSNKDETHQQAFFVFLGGGLAPDGRSSHLTSCLRRAAEKRKHGEQQADFKYHLTVGVKITKTHQNGSPRRICSVALMLFPLRELTGHIIRAKNIRREWGRTGAGVGLRGGAHGRPSFLVGPKGDTLIHLLAFRDSRCVGLVEQTL